MEKLISPADKFAAAKKRTDHPITQKFVDSFDFAFDDFQVAVTKRSKAAIRFGFLSSFLSSLPTTRATHHESNLSALLGVGGSIKIQT